MIDRRAFLTGSLAALLARLAVAGKPAEAAAPHVGYVSLRPRASHLEAAFQHGLREAGYVDGQNVALTYRYADWSLDRMAALAEELARRPVAVLVATGGTAATLAVKRVVTTVPVVFTAGDPVAAGIVPRIDRPGGNLTGVNLVTTELNPKRLDLLKAALPGLTRVAVLDNPGPVTRSATAVREAARTLGLTVQSITAREPGEIDQAFATIARERAGAVLVLASPMFFAERERVIGLCTQHRLPAMFEQSEFTEAGGLLSYGASTADMYRRLATYVDKILKGARAGDLPVEQPTRFELVINLRTARALGLTIPQPVVLRADRVIE